MGTVIGIGDRNVVHVAPRNVLVEQIATERERLGLPVTVIAAGGAKVLCGHHSAHALYCRGSAVLPTYYVCTPDVLQGDSGRFLVAQLAMAATQHEGYPPTLFVMDEVHSAYTEDNAPYLSLIEYLGTLSRRTSGLFDFRVAGLSATVPQDILDNLKRELGEDLELMGEVNLSSNHLIVEVARVDSYGSAIEELKKALVVSKTGRCLVFTPTLAIQREVQQELTGLKVFACHGDSMEGLEKFKAFKGPATLLTTSALSYGLNLKSIDTVVVFAGMHDLLQVFQAFGRAAREPGSSGRALWLWWDRGFER